MTTVLKIDHLWKEYRLGVIGHGSLVQDFQSWWARVRGREDPNRRVTFVAGEAQPGRDRIWALQDLSLEVKQGEILGIIGVNGAGKSTLLKVISQVTGPTRGEIKIRGRVASLLEVGTGFHPELTGRENIYLNGAILGMTIGETRRKFDQIIDFSGLELFVDTPVKRYSSGMYTRLAFAVAAHLDAEILIVDEVLAVGDVEFQKKCLTRMGEVTSEGRTVLFVSHNMPAIARLCPRAILLDRGRLSLDAPSSRVISTYLSSGLRPAAEKLWPDLMTAPGNNAVRLTAVRVQSENGQVTGSLDVGRPIGIEMEYEVLKPGHNFCPGFSLINERGIQIFSSNDLDRTWYRQPRPAGRYTSTAWIPGNLLAEGTYVIGAVTLSDADGIIFHVKEKDVLAFQTVDHLEGNSPPQEDGGAYGGIIKPLLKWTTNPAK